jgi:Zn-dependent M28 family amino/carboxypeptidase
VLFLAHWDHFGQCAQAPAEHLICNGAIDNASGVAALIETARRLSRAPQMDRDIYFLATTAEELGLLGATAFAENPPLPLKQIVAAFNIDSIALAPAGTALGMVGMGKTGLDKAIAEVAKREKRAFSASDAGNAYLKRQDGWALMQHDIPAVMVTSAYGDIARIEKFFDGDYHRPGDRVKPGLELGGAAQDVTFYVALGKWFADVRRVPAAPSR